MAKKVGRLCKVAIGSSKIVGVGTFNVPGVSWEEVDSSEMGTDIKEFLLGLATPGPIPMSGQWDPADVSGQQVLISANFNGTPVADLRFYQDSTSYFTATTTNPTSTVYVTKFDLKAAMNGLISFDLEVKNSGGKFVLV